MPQIVTRTHFQNSNWLYIPLSKENIVANPSIQTPSNVSYIDNLCIETERCVLLNSLGVDLYNRLQTALADIDNPLNADYKKLVQGETYDGKVWRGLDYDYSLIACKIMLRFLQETSSNLAGIGVIKVNPQGAENVSPNNVIVKANQMFIEQYQGQATKFPKVKNNTLTWLGLTNTNEVSLFRYLSDRADVLDWNSSVFVFDGVINNLGL